MFMSMKNFIENRNRDITACNAVLNPTASQRVRFVE